MLHKYVARALIARRYGSFCPENGSKCEGINDKEDIMNVLLCKKLKRDKK